jgi:hypothetical protein
MKQGIGRRPPFALRCCSWWVWLDRGLAGRWVQDQGSGVGVLEIKHRVQATGKVIKGARDPLTTQPVILDKAQNRGLVSDRVIDVVLSCVG